MVVAVDDLAAIIAGLEGIVGITFSGGEPFDQAAGLAALARRVRESRDLGVVCFTGHTLESLRSKGAPSADDLLAQVDLLIDGPFLADRPPAPFWRGSDNQRLHFLTPRYARLKEGSEGAVNELQVDIANGQAIVSGDLTHSPLHEITALLSQLHGVDL